MTGTGIGLIILNTSGIVKTLTFLSCEDWDEERANDGDGGAAAEESETEERKGS
jgi:hypothetical protein